MPTVGVDIDHATLALLDADKDGRVRKDDILKTIDWLSTTFTDVGDVLKSSPQLKLAQLSDAKVVATAKRMLHDLGKADAKAISIDDVDAVAKTTLDSKLNGDGIVTASSTADAELQRAIGDVIAAMGSKVDRSGKPGVDKPAVDAFLADVDKHAAWIAARVDVLGDRTAAADEAFTAVRAKLDDYFTRCAFAAYDPRGNAALAGQDAELVALSTRLLTAHDDEIAKLPIGHVATPARLSLTTGLNPSWVARMATFAKAAVEPILGTRDALTPAELAAIADKLAPYQTWLAARPATKVAALDVGWLAALALPGIRERLYQLIAEDVALEAEYAEVASVDKAVRLQRDFGRVLRNFVNFSDFYGKQDGVFQAGTLYLDSRAMHLTVAVSDAGKHAALAGSSDSYLAYCDISRHGGAKQQVAVAVTNGDSDNIFVGRNGLFYDRQGQDWDATIAKIIGNPISIREAFWTPYKKLIKVVEDNVTKREQAAESKSMGHVDAAGAAIADPTPAPPAAPAAPAKKIDLGTVAALGVAIGGIGTLFGALFATLFGLGPWIPFGIAAVFLLISGPSMLLAWLKLRRRNMGPILDANGWAINGRARVNVAFGAALTELARLPKDAQRSLDVPFADTDKLIAAEHGPIPQIFREHGEPHFRQLNVYAHIWQTLRGQPVDAVALVATKPPRALKHALSSGDPRRIKRALDDWEPVIAIDIDQTVVEDVMDDFGRVVDCIEGHAFAPPDVEVLRAPSRLGARVP
ncbi:MAG: hypothetical protein NT062_24945, partial [Proteobacteria bacterium]|nr:hypothetical protein [Pseudomonadota bacterium]